jgi:hypothetical protein
LNYTGWRDPLRIVDNATRCIGLLASLWANRPRPVKQFLAVFLLLTRQNAPFYK